MQLKMIGAVVILASGIWAGYIICANYKKEADSMAQLVRALDYMGCELQFRMTPLPILCREAAACCHGPLRQFWQALAVELDNQLLPDATNCVNCAIDAVGCLPQRTRQQLLLLGSSMGRFDLAGQMEGIEAVRQSCRRDLDQLLGGQTSYIRSCKTLALCAAAALAILFI